MFPPIWPSSLFSAAIFSSSPFSNIFSSKITQRIKEIAAINLQRISDFFTLYGQSNENNVKAFALVSCLSLISLLVISMLRKRDAPIVFPFTPRKSSEKIA